MTTQQCIVFSCVLAFFVILLIYSPHRQRMRRWYKFVGEPLKPNEVLVKMQLTPEQVDILKKAKSEGNTEPVYIRLDNFNLLIWKEYEDPQVPPVNPDLSPALRL